MTFINRVGRGDYTGGDGRRPCVCTSDHRDGRSQDEVGYSYVGRRNHGGDRVHLFVSRSTVVRLLRETNFGW